MKLTESQREAVRHDGNTLVVACPGSGKTRALIAKLLRCLDGIRDTPRRIACITYTNAAVYEIVSSFWGALQTLSETLFDDGYAVVQNVSVVVSQDSDLPVFARVWEASKLDYPFSFSHPLGSPSHLRVARSWHRRFQDSHLKAQISQPSAGRSPQPPSRELGSTGSRHQPGLRIRSFMRQRIASTETLNNLARLLIE